MRFALRSSISRSGRWPAVCARRDETSSPECPRAGRTPLSSLQAPVRPRLGPVTPDFLSLYIPATSKGFEFQDIQARPPFAIQVLKPDSRGRTCFSHGFRQLAGENLFGRSGLRRVQ